MSYGQDPRVQFRYKLLKSYVNKNLRKEHLYKVVQNNRTSYSKNAVAVADYIAREQNAAKINCLKDLLVMLADGNNDIQYDIQSFISNVYNDTFPQNERSGFWCCDDDVDECRNFLHSLVSEKTPLLDNIKLSMVNEVRELVKAASLTDDIIFEEIAKQINAQVAARMVEKQSRQSRQSRQLELYSYSQKICKNGSDYLSYIALTSKVFFDDKTLFPSASTASRNIRNILSGAYELYGEKLAELNESRQPLPKDDQRKPKPKKREDSEKNPKPKQKRKKKSKKEPGSNSNQKKSKQPRFFPQPQNDSKNKKKPKPRKSVDVEILYRQSMMMHGVSAHLFEGDNSCIVPELTYKTLDENIKAEFSEIQYKNTLWYIRAFMNHDEVKAMKSFTDEQANTNFINLLGKSYMVIDGSREICKFSLKKFDRLVAEAGHSPKMEKK